MASAGDLVIQLPIPDAGSDTKDGQSPLGGFRTAVNLALSIAKKLPPRDRRTMHDAIDELKRKAVFAPKNFAPNIHVDQSINASEHATVQADRSQSVSVSVDWALHIGVLIDELLRVVAVQLEGVSDRRPTVIFADDFHAISNEAIEEWMRSLPYRLPKVRIVITADPVRRSLNLGQEFRKHTLPAFTRDEVEAFLRSPSDVAVSPALTDPIFETTGGWPWAVALIANTLTNREFQAQDCLRLVGSDAFGQNVADGSYSAGLSAGGSHAPVVKSWRRASSLSCPHLVAVSR